MTMKSRGSFFGRILNSNQFFSYTEQSELDDVPLKHKSRKTATNKSKQVVKKKTVNAGNTKFPTEYFGSAIKSRLQVKVIR